jgi:hypothetical protein
VTRREDGGWWYGEVDTVGGWFPANHAAPLASSGSSSDADEAHTEPAVLLSESRPDDSAAIFSRHSSMPPLRRLGSTVSGNTPPGNTPTNNGGHRSQAGAFPRAGSAPLSLQPGKQAAAMPLSPHGTSSVRRSDVVKELLALERAFLQTLLGAHSRFVEPLSAVAWLTAADKTTLLALLHPVLDLHQRLLRDLSRAADASSESLGKVLGDFALETTAVHTHFASLLPAATALLDGLWGRLSNAPGGGGCAYPHIVVVGWFFFAD